MAYQNSQTENFGNKMEKVAHQVGDKMTSAYDSTRETLTQASEEVKKLNSQFEGLVKSNPMMAVGISVGLGWIIGRFINGRQTPSKN